MAVIGDTIQAEEDPPWFAGINWWVVHCLVIVGAIAFASRLYCRSSALWMCDAWTSDAAGATTMVAGEEPVPEPGNTQSIQDTGSQDTGSQDTGSQDTGSQDTGSQDTSSQDTDSAPTCDGGNGDQITCGNCFTAYVIFITPTFTA